MKFKKEFSGENFHQDKPDYSDDTTTIKSDRILKIPSHPHPSEEGPFGYTTWCICSVSKSPPPPLLKPQPMPMIEYGKISVKCLLSCNFFSHFTFWYYHYTLFQYPFCIFFLQHEIPQFFVQNVLYTITNICIPSPALKFDRLNATES